MSEERFEVFGLIRGIDNQITELGGFENEWRI